MKTPPPFTKIPAYRTASNQRDSALERILLKGRARTSDQLRRFMLLVQGELARVYPLLNREYLDPQTRRQIQGLDAQLDRHAYELSIACARIWNFTRHQAYTVAHASEQRALILSGLRHRPKRADRDEHLTAAYRPTSLGQVEDRAYLAFSRLKRKVMDAVELGRIQGEDLRQVVDRALSAFPAAERRLQAPRELMRLREADRPTIASLKEKLDLDFTEFVDEEEAEKIVRDYVSKFVPEWRDPRYGELPSPVSVGESGEAVTYPWELEREMTEDFVDSVTAGTHEGAKKLGITDFVWIAVIDKKTDDCCLKRDGLTSAEIASKLEGEWADDECRAKVPPAHFNCRCRLAPATDDLPEVPESNARDFEEWLTA